VAGLWYLLLILLGPLRLIYIPNKLFVAGNPTATINQIAVHELLFRLGIADDVFVSLVLVLLTYALYQLLAPTDRHLASLVIAFGGIMPALLYLTGATADLGVLTIVNGAPFLNGLTTPQQHALAMFLLKLHDLQNTVAETLWGAWMLPLGLLVYRSQFLPRFLGVWVFLGGLAYLMMSFTGVLMPRYSGRVFYCSQPFTFSEIALTLWLVIRGFAEPMNGKSARHIRD
jgi:hypothetical protein